MRTSQDQKEVREINKKMVECVMQETKQAMQKSKAQKNTQQDLLHYGLPIPTKKKIGYDKVNMIKLCNALNIPYLG